MERLRELPREYGVWTALFTVVATMVGAGILTASGLAIRSTGNHQAVLLIWTIGGVLALAGAFTVAEMGAAMPRVGGDYIFVREAFGPAIAFVYGWSTLLFGFAGPLAILSLQTVRYLFDPIVRLEGKLFLGVDASLVVATLLIAIFTATHCFGHRESAWVQSGTTIFKLVTLLGLALAGLIWGSGSWRHWTEGKPWSEQRPDQLAQMLVYVMYSYSGWNGAVYLAGEVRDPARTLPRAILGGCGAVAAIYIIVNLAYAYALDPNRLMAMSEAEVEPIARLATDQLFSSGASEAIAILLGLGILSSISAYIFTGARIAFAMAQDGMLPRFASTTHATRDTPVAATLTLGLISSLFIWAGPFQRLLQSTSIGLAVLSALMVGAVFPLRRRSDYRPAFRMPLFPLPPIVFLLAATWMTAAATISDPLPSLACLASMAAGLPIYWIFLRPSKSNPSAS